MLVIVCFLAITTFGQKKEKSIKNLDFENVKNGKAVYWQSFGADNYILKIDSAISQNGKHSALIEFNGDSPSFKAWSYNIPAIYQGKTIKLTGYIKTENVTDGYAGIWMQIEPSIGFDNMSNRGLKGTNDWAKYEIELDLNPSEAKEIQIGGLLVGKGKVWIDNFQITIDGKQLDSVPLKEISKAEKDTEFKDGSKINSIELNNKKIENLKTLGLIWGFLKYYHPSISDGNYNWDFELFRILPEILNCKNITERDEIITSWIKNLGDYKLARKDNEQTNDIKLKPDLDWITNSNLSKELISELQNISNSERKDKNYYIGFDKNSDNLYFKNEDPYSEMKYPDAGFRLLSLYRYWNIIQFYFPYKNLIEEDWKNVLTEFIPKFINAKNELEYKLTTLELIARVHDTHANIWGYDNTLNNYWGKKYSPLGIKFIENKAIVTDYLDQKLGKETGLIIGDNITKINSKLVTDIVKEKLKYTPASNYPTQLRNLSDNLLRTKDSIINIEFIRNNEIHNTTLKTFTTKEINIYSKYLKSDTCFKFINNEIAYLYLGSIKKSYLPEIFKKIKNTKGLVIDLRCYPSEVMAYCLSKYLMPQKTKFVKFSMCNIENAGLFTLTECFEVGEKNEDYYKGEVIILINETTQSQAEYTTMAFRVAPKATVIGSTTAGADGNTSPFYLPGSIETMISGIGVYYPDGTETQRVGIVPDIEIKPSIQGIKEGRDELMEKAIEIINVKGN